MGLQRRASFRKDLFAPLDLCRYFIQLFRQHLRVFAHRLLPFGQSQQLVGTTRLRRVDSEWQRDGESIDYGVATDLLYEISGGAAERAVAPASIGELGAPELTFRLIPEGESDGTGATAESGAPEVAAPEVLTLYPARDDGTPARVTGREVVLVLSAETARALREKVDALRAAPVQDPPGVDPEVLEGAPGASAGSSPGL
jgi:hypothetical protein